MINITYDRDDRVLERLVEAARNHKMTPAERRAQLVSFVYGQMGGDREEVRQMLARHYGWPDEGVGA